MIDEKAIVQDVLEGNKDSFRLLVERYQTGLVRYAYSIVLDEELANDIAQQAFINSYLNLRSYKSKYAFSTWLYKIARNEAYKQMKKQQGRTEFDESVDVSESNVAEYLDKITDHKRVHTAMKKLRIEWRQIIHFYYWEHKNYEEISELMDTPLNTIKVWMSRAKKQLEQELLT